MLRFTRCVFGVTSSPFHLLATIIRHTAKYVDRYKSVVDEIRRSMYVDDLVSGADTEAEAYSLFVTAKKIFKEGGFNLRKFSSNSQALECSLESCVQSPRVTAG